MSVIPIFAVVLIGLAVFWTLGWLKQRRRDEILATPLTPEQRHIIAQLVPITRKLPVPLQRKLEGKINLFLNQITFHGQNGLEVTEPMRLSIAAHACLLVVNSDAWFETLRTVLIYPSTFTASRGTHDGNVVQEHHHAMLGESWTRGPVVLSWDHALEGGLDPHDGHNVVIHEFAHQLDSLTGHTNGIPILSRGQTYTGWEEAMLDAYESHVVRVERGQHTLIDPYGATNHQEFLAEAIVTFFERPKALLQHEPALYAQLKELLALDPAQWG